MSEFDLTGLPKDLLTSKFEGARSLKVSINEVGELLKTLTLALIESESVNHELLSEVKLLNSRIEEAFNTKIQAGDL